MKRVPLFLMLCSVLSLNEQLRNNDVYEIAEMNQSHVRNEIHIPDVKGYKNIKMRFSHPHRFF